jgi:hypothetical protein
MIDRSFNLPIRAKSTSNESFLLVALVVFVEVDAVREVVFFAVEAGVLGAAEVAAVVAQIAIALALDLVEAITDAAIFAIGEASVADALIDAGVLIVNAISNFAGTGGERDERDERGSGENRCDTHDDDSKERGVVLLLESTQICAPS